MNPVGAAGNIFSSLFDKVPAKRAGASGDIAGTVLYLVSKAGVSYVLQTPNMMFTYYYSHMSMGSRFVSMVDAFCWRTGRSDETTTATEYQSILIYR
jgi:hypothetical protein